MTKRNVWLLIMSVVIGPLVGSLALMIGTTLFDWLFAGGGPGAMKFMADYWPLVLSTGYALGFIPAVVFSIAMAFLSSRIANKRTRLWVAPLIGAVASGVVMGFFVVGGLVGIADSVYILLAIVVTGAIAGLLCMAVIEWLHPMPASAKAAS